MRIVTQLWLYEDEDYADVAHPVPAPPECPDCGLTLQLEGLREVRADGVDVWQFTCDSGVCLTWLYTYEVANRAALDTQLSQ
jgi:hypothetical protein